MFAVDVERVRAFEWSHELGTWSLLDPTSSIEDRSLAVPLPVDALVRASKTDDALANALLAKRNSVLVAALLGALGEGEAKGQATGRAQSILDVLEQREVAVGADEYERILAERDVETLKRWLKRAMTCASVNELFVE